MSTGDRKHYTPHDDLTDLAVAIRDLDATSEALQIQIRDAIEALTIEMTTTKIEITTAQCPALDINHSGVDSCKVIDLTPSAALNPASIWFAMYMSLAALSPSGAGCQLHGIEIDFSGVDLTHDPDIDGISVKLPAAYAGGTEVAGYFAGDGRTVSLCTDAYALAISGAMQLDGIITGMNSLACDLGTSINEFSTDDTLSGDSDDAVPTEQAVKAYADAIQADVDGFQDGLKDLTAIEITQLKNIGISTISPTQWGYLGVLDQTLIQASSPTFVGLTLSGAITGLTDLTMTGAIATPTTITTSGDITCGGDLMVDGGSIYVATGAGFISAAGPGYYGSNFYYDGQFKRGMAGSSWLFRGTVDGTFDIMGGVTGVQDGVINFTSRLSLDDLGNLQIDGSLTAVGANLVDELDMTGSGACIDLNPASTGTKAIIDITPSAALVADSIWYGIKQALGALDPATGAFCSIWGSFIDAANLTSVDKDAKVYGYYFGPPATEASIGYYMLQKEMTENKIQSAFMSFLGGTLSYTATYRGLHIDWDVVARDANAPVLEGVRVELPASYAGFGTSFAGYFSGDGRSVYLCNTTYALDVSGIVRVVGDVTVDNLITAGNVDGVDVSAHAADSDLHVAHSGVSVIAGTGLSGGGTIAASRTIDCTITQYTDALAIAAVVAENPLTLTNALLIGSIVAGTADYDAFLVSHAGTVKYRTGAQVLSDIGASATGHTHTHASTTGQTANDHHNESHDIASHSDITFTGAQLEDAAFHAGTWMPCNYMGNDLKEVWGTSLSNLSNPTTNNQYLVFQLPLPPVKGALKLYVTGVRVGLFDADGTNYVDEMWVYGIKYTGRTYLTVSDRTVNKNAPGLHEYTMANFDCSTYETVAVEFLVALANVGALDISSVSLLCYYGA